MDEVCRYTSWWSGTGDEVVGDGDNRMKGGQRCVGVVSHVKTAIDEVPRIRI